MTNKYENFGDKENSYDYPLSYARSKTLNPMNTGAHPNMIRQLSLVAWTTDVTAVADGLRSVQVSDFDDVSAPCEAHQRKGRQGVAAQRASRIAAPPPG